MTPFKKLCKAACAFLIAAGSMRADIVVLKNFTLIDGTGRAAAPNSAMIIDNGRITWVGPVRDLKAPAAAGTVDLSGKFVMPGIISLHVHLGNAVGLVQDPKNYTRESVEHDLKTYAMYGVTTVLSLGLDKDMIFGIRDAQRAGRPAEARVYTAGLGIIYKGGFGGADGVPSPEVATVADVEPAVAALAKKKVDFIKFWSDDNYGARKRMPYDIQKAIIDSAHKRGLPAIAHIFYLDDAQHMADSGIDGLAHSVRDKPVNQALIDSMKKHGTWLAAATLSREEALFSYTKTPAFASDPFFTMGVSADVIKAFSNPEYQKAQRLNPNIAKFPVALDIGEKNLKALADGGVRYGMGTDTGVPGRFAGFFEHEEMELMVKAGLTPAQVITAATKSGAEFLKAKDLGTLEPSKWADLIVLTQNPLSNIHNTRTIDAVYIAGKKVR